MNKKNIAKGNFIFMLLLFTLLIITTAEVNAQEEQSNNFFDQWDLADYFVLSLDLNETDGNNVSLHNISLEMLPVFDLQPETSGEYKALYVNVFGKIMLEIGFNFTDNFTSYNNIPCGTENSEALGEAENGEVCQLYPNVTKNLNKSKTLLFPYSNYVQSIVIQDENQNTLLIIPLTEYSDYCGDGKCSINEGHYSCPGECEEQQVPLSENELFKVNKAELLSQKNKIEVYMKENMCKNSLNACAEILEDQNKANFYMKGDTVATFKDDSKYGILNSKITDSSKLVISTKDGASAQLSNGPIELSGDWKSLGNMKHQYNFHTGKVCTQTFDPTSNTPVKQTCG